MYASPSQPFPPLFVSETVIFTVELQLSAASLISDGFPAGIKSILAKLATLSGAVPVGAVLSLTVIT